MAWAPCSGKDGCPGVLCIVTKSINASMTLIDDFMFQCCYKYLTPVCHKIVFDFLFFREKVSSWPPRLGSHIARATK